MIQLRELDGGLEFTSTRQHAGIEIPAVVHACQSSRHLTQRRFDAVHREFWPAGDTRRVSDYPITKKDILYIGTANKSFWKLLLNTPVKAYHEYDHQTAKLEKPICRKCNVAIDAELLLSDRSMRNIFQITHHLNDKGLKLYIVMALKARTAQGPLRLTSRLRESDSRYWSRDIPSTSLGQNVQHEFARYMADALDDNFGVPDSENWDDRRLKNRIKAFIIERSIQHVRRLGDVDIVKATGDIVGHKTYTRIFTLFYRQAYNPSSRMELSQR